MDEFIRFEVREEVVTSAQREAQREAIARQTEEYLAKGGKIEIIAQDVSRCLINDGNISIKTPDDTFLERKSARTKNSRLLQSLARDLGLKGATVYFFAANPKGYRLKLDGVFVTESLGTTFEKSEEALRKYVAKRGKFAL